MNLVIIASHSVAIDATLKNERLIARSYVWRGLNKAQ
jgi:hypothetical protein